MKKTFNPPPTLYEAANELSREVNNLTRLILKQFEWLFEPILNYLVRTFYPTEAQPMLAILQYDIGKWSRKNFGGQESKAARGLVLGSLAPLMGVAEEIGELFSADNTPDMRDAIGDICVYLCDYADREHFSLTDVDCVTIDESAAEPLENVVAALGRLFHVTLKRHQGIRGFDDFDKYRRERNINVGIILAGLRIIAKEDLGEDVIHILDDTWKKVVTKRNWKTAPEASAHVSHNPVPKALGYATQGTFAGPENSPTEKEQPSGVDSGGDIVPSLDDYR